MSPGARLGARHGQDVPPTSIRGADVSRETVRTESGMERGQVRTNPWGAGTDPAGQIRPGTEPRGLVKTAGRDQGTLCHAAESDTRFGAASTFMQPPMWDVRIRRRSLSLEHRYSADSAVDARETDLRRRGGPFRIRKAGSEVQEVGHVRVPWTVDELCNYRRQ